MAEHFITIEQYRELDKYKAPPIIYVDELPEQPENTVYGIEHTDIETHEYMTKFTDILSSYFVEESKGKWKIKDNFTVQVADNEPFKSAALVGNKYFIYANEDWTDMYPTEYNPYIPFLFSVSEEIEHTDYWAGNAEESKYVKLANVDEVERYFIRKNEKGKANGVASLDANGRVPVEQMPVQAFVYLGQWDASTGKYPPDADTPGDFYEVSEPGIIEGVEFLKGDWIVWGNEGWHKSENKNYVTEVNKKRGIVEVYGDNTEIETPSESETTDTRTIKEYIDDQDRDSVIEVKELPTDAEYNKVYNLYEEESKKDTVRVFSKDIEVITKTYFENNKPVVEDENDPRWESYPDNYIYLKRLEEENDKVFAKDVRLPTYKDFEDEQYLVHEEGGDNINVVYDGEKDTINNTLKKVGTVKTVDFGEPTDNNIISRAVIDLPDEHQEDFADTDKVFRTKDAEGNIQVYAKDTKLITKEEFDKEAVKTVNTILPDEDGNVETVVELTKQEYLDLCAQGLDDPNKVYYVTNEGSSAEFINDLTVSESTTWSSKMIRDAITAATPVVFDDAQVSTQLGWSSNKIKNELDSLTQIDDTKASDKATYSSNKTESLISTAKGEVIADVNGRGYIPKDDTTPSADKVWSSEKTNSAISNATNDMATQTWVGENYQPIGTYLVPNDIADMETKTHAANTYEPKNSDLATKTWVEAQGYRKEAVPSDNITSSNFLNELKKYIYVSGGNIIVNL